MDRPTELTARQERLLRGRISLALSAEPRRRATDEDRERFLGVLCWAVRDLRGFPGQVRFHTAATSEENIGDGADTANVSGTTGGNGCS